MVFPGFRAIQKILSIQIKKHVYEFNGNVGSFCQSFTTKFKANNKEKSKSTFY